MEAIEPELPDLTILDLNMPVKDGEQVLEEVRLLDADLPVLVLTALEVNTQVRWIASGTEQLDDQALQPARAACALPSAFAPKTGDAARGEAMELDRLKHTAAARWTLDCSATSSRCWSC